MNVGLIFSLDTIMYTFTSMVLNFVREEDDGKKYGKIQYYGLLFFVASMLLTGPAHALEESVETIHINNDLCTLIAGILLAGVGGALVNNNSTPAMILTEHEESEKRLQRPLSKREKEKLQSTVAAINTGGFGLGSILGPILASLLNAHFGFQIAFMVAGLIVFVLSFLRPIDSLFYILS